MAGKPEGNPDEVAHQWFMATVVGAALYIGAVFTFIL